MIMEGLIKRLIDIPTSSMNDRFLETNCVYWTDGTYRPNQKLFLARVGKSYVTTCFIPIGFGCSCLFLDQTYSIVRQFYTLKPSLDDANKTFHMEFQATAKRYEGPCVLVGGTPEKNWYHWTLNWLPRLNLVSILNRDLIKSRDVRFVFHCNAEMEPFISTISAFGISRERMIFIDPEQGAIFEDLIIPTMTDQNYYFPTFLKACRRLTSRLPPQGMMRERPRRIYISRESINEPKRRIANYDAVLTVLNKYNVSPVLLEETAGAEQVDLFRNAELVIGVHGAGLANLLYSNTNCFCIILDNARNIDVGMAGMFTGLADCLRLNYDLIEVSEEIRAGVNYDEFYNIHNRDVIVDVDKLDQSLENFENNTRNKMDNHKLQDRLNDEIRKTDEMLEVLTPFAGDAPKGYDVNFLGVKSGIHLLAHWYPKDGAEFIRNNERAVETTLPNPTWGEPYFEYGALLRAIEEGGDTIDIVELGGGYGARSCDLAFMCKAFAKKSRALVVEPVPQYVEWARRHFADNRLDQIDHIVIPVAVTPQSRPLPMFTAYQGFGNEVLREGGNVDGSEKVPVRALFDCEQITLPSGTSIEMVNGLSIADILAAKQQIDIMDIDVQHLEHAILISAWNVVNAKVRRLHIGTHSKSLHEAVKADLLRNSWDIEIDLLPYSTNECFGGPTKIADGILSARNPRMEDRTWRRCAC
jgi:FkbM family methyltransferase